MSLVSVKDISVSIDKKQILKNISLNFDKGEVVVVLGPNGAGKSTLANVLMGNPKYKVNLGDIFFDDINITNLEVDKRINLGMFLSFQSPEEIEGVTFLNFLRTSYNLVKKENISLRKFLPILEEKMDLLGMDKNIRSREVNVGFSGGEKKKAEILQLLLLEPKFIMLDEIDSGLDVDALKLIGKAVRELRERNKTSFMIVTHNNNILKYLNPDKVVILVDGSVSKVGGKELVEKVEEEGFNKFS